jgi:hypothetical protein
MHARIILATPLALHRLAVDFAYASWDLTISSLGAFCIDSEKLCGVEMVNMSGACLTNIDSICVDEK